MIKAILTDIEGTTSSISFVKDVLFPYAFDQLPTYLAEHADNPAVAKCLSEITEIAQLKNPQLKDFVAVLRQWIDEDKKITPLKSLQGLIWQAGYSNGDFKAHLYLDAYENLKRWQAAGILLYVYSSGSIKAQELFFSHTEFGDISQWFTGFFDTTSGAKRESQSYRNIVAALNLPPEEILFLSDIEEELDAAKIIGINTCWVQRESNLLSLEHPIVNSFDEIVVASL